MKTHCAAPSDNKRRLFAACLMALLWTALVESAVFGEYIEVDLYPYYTEDYNLFDHEYRGFFDYFDQDHITIPDLSEATFYVKSRNHPGPHVLSSTLEGTESFRIPIGKSGVVRLYVLGTGTYLASPFGHSNLWCEDLSHFSFTLSYSDGTEEEVFPVNTLTGLPRWSDILHGYKYEFDGVAVGHFPASDWGHYHLYEIAVDNLRTLTAITMNDKAGGILGLDNVGDYAVLAMTLEVTSIPVELDIKPNSNPNSINPKSKGMIPVAILTTGDFDATTVDPLAVRFGPSGASITPRKGYTEDLNLDGYTDLVLHFQTQETGIQCGDTSASLTGETFGGQQVEGSDSISTVGCK